MNNAQKTPFVRSLNDFAQRKVLDVVQVLGKALPASVVSVSGSIVTVSFQVNSKYTLPNVKVPIAGPEYIRMPTQVGDLGVVFPADVHLGGITGLGGGVADLSAPANLAALTFFPIGNANWTTTDDANALVGYGPNGFIWRSQDSNTKIIGTPTSLTLKVGGKSIVITGSSITIDGKVWETHIHSGVSTGSSDTGPPA